MQTFKDSLNESSNILAPSIVAGFVSGLLVASIQKGDDFLQFLFLLICLMILIIGGYALVLYLEKK